MPATAAAPAGAVGAATGGGDVEHTPATARPLRASSARLLGSYSALPLLATTEGTGARDAPPSPTAQQLPPGSPSNASAGGVPARPEDGSAAAAAAAAVAAAAAEDMSAATERAGALVLQLGSSEAAAQLPAVEAVTALCAGARDRPCDEAACTALLASGAVPELLRLADVRAAAALPAPADSARCAAAALGALRALTDVHPPSRSAVAVAGGLPVMLAALMHTRADAGAADAVVHVLCHASRDDTLADAFRTTGVLAALVKLIASAASGGEPAAGGTHSLAPPTNTAALIAAITALRKVCTGHDANKVAVHDAGGVAALAALLTPASEVTPHAVLALQLLASHADCRDALHACGGVPRLVALLREEQSAATVRAAAAALVAACASGSDGVAHAVAVREAGAVPALLSLLACGIAAQVGAAAASALRTLACSDDGAGRDAVCAGGAGAHALVALVREPDACRDAVAALRSLCGSDEGEDDTACVARRAVVLDAGGAAALVHLVRDDSDADAATVAHAARALHGLCRLGESGQDAVMRAGGVSALVMRLARADASNEDAAAAALWALAQDCAHSAEEVRNCGGIGALLDAVKRHSDTSRGAAAPPPVVRTAVCALLALATHEFLHAALVQAHVLGIVEPVARAAAEWDDGTLLACLLLVACAYSSHSGPVATAPGAGGVSASAAASASAATTADALLADYDLTGHVVDMLDAVLAAPRCSYLHIEMTVREVCVYTHLISVSAAHAERLVAAGAPKLLVQLLPARHAAHPAEAATLQHVCRALGNFAFVPALHAQLRDAGVPAALQELLADGACCDDEQTSDAAKGVLLALHELGDAVAEAAAVAAEDAVKEVCAGAAGLAAAPSASAGGAAGASNDALASIPPAVPASASPRFQVFLSHKRTDAKDFARGLHTWLLLRGITAFLDYENAEQLDSLKNVVKACDNFVFILTGACCCKCGYLAQHSCMKPLCPSYHD
jgi:hypothetical protein